MNIIWKSFCRIYQSAFHAALPILPYREPKIFDSVAGLEYLLIEHKIKSVLLVTDHGLRSNGVTSHLEALLQENHIHCAVYDQTCANPTVHNVEEARELYIKENCEAIIAFGGGSSIDCAKAVGARIAYPKKSLNQLKGLLRVLKRIPMLIAVPTTAGTGSEVTLAAVITDSEEKHKYTMNDFTLIPSYRLALEAVQLIFENIETAYRDGTHRKARENMLLAAYKAGIAFSKSYVGYIHAVAHSLGGQYNIPHGLANSVLMPIILEEYGEHVHRKLHELGIAAGVASDTDTHKAGAEKFICAIRNLNRNMNIPDTLSGIRQEDIPKMARHAAKEANPLYPVPVLMSAKELEMFYKKAADWRQNDVHRRIIRKSA
ncbi:MAG: iron-containing alcohol dehydrogenase [Lachnospiraceae bacterium]